MLTLGLPFQVQVQGAGQSRVVAPTMYYSEFTKGIMRHPDVLNLINKDFYVAPLSLEETAGAQTESIELVQGAPHEHGDLTLTYSDFTFDDDAREAMLEGRTFEMRVTLLVGETGSKKRTPVVLRMIGGGEEGMEFPLEQYATADGGTLGLRLQKVTPPDQAGGASTASVVVEHAAPQTGDKRETLVVEASIKPMINLVWAGTVTLIIGFALTIVRRVAEARSHVRNDEEDHEEWEN